MSRNGPAPGVRRPSGAEEGEAACRGRRGGGSASPTIKETQGLSNSCSGSERRAVWISGAGPVTPLGSGRSFRDRIFGERPRYAPAPVPAGAPGPALTLDASGFSADEYVDPRFTRRLSALSRSALAAARLALLDARYPEEPAVRTETGVVLGTAFGSAAYHFEYYEGLFRRGLKEASPLLFSESVLNAACGHVSHYLGLRGPSVTLVGGEDVGLAAVASALDQIRSGAAPALLAGGAEEYCATIHRALVDAEVVAGTGPESSGGLPLGEGAAVLLLEDAARARARGAAPPAAVLGAGWGRARAGEAGSGEHAARAAASALADAGVAAEEIGLLVSGADGGAKAAPELHGLERVLGEERPPHVLFPKRLLGEGFAFSSAAQALLAALALATGRAPAGFGSDAESALDRPCALVLSTTRRGGAVAVVLGKA